VSVTIVVGGQYGSEGKGKVVALEAGRLNAPTVVRCGGPNSGHTIVLGGKRIVLRQVPAGVVNPDSLLMLAPGCAIDAEILVREVRELGVERERIIVDPRAVIVTQRDRDAETDWSGSIGSTASGTGAALIRRMHRSSPSILAGGSDLVRSVARVEPISALCHHQVDRGGHVVVEGTQGFGLSLLHGTYPYVTARDTTAAGFVSEVGLAPHQVTRVVMVMRTFPIRVGGDSGPLEGETSWERICELGGAPVPVPEFTSVTRKLRRVAAFDWDLARRAALINRPTNIAVMGVDRLNYRNTHVPSTIDLTEDARAFLGEVRAQLGAPVDWVGTGFGAEAFRMSGV
jgi:adenylosuccinate synthase